MMLLKLLQLVMPVEMLDDLPMPDYKYLSDKYFSPIPVLTLDIIARTGWIITSRGCPYKCVFCASASMWDKMRSYSAPYVAKHVKYLIDTYKIEHLRVLYIVH